MLHLKTFEENIFRDLKSKFNFSSFKKYLKSLNLSSYEIHTNSDGNLAYNLINDGYLVVFKLKNKEIINKISKDINSEIESIYYDVSIVVENGEPIEIFIHKTSLYMKYRIDGQPSDSQKNNIMIKPRYGDSNEIYIFTDDLLPYNKKTLKNDLKKLLDNAISTNAITNIKNDLKQRSEDSDRRNKDKIDINSLTEEINEYLLPLKDLSVESTIIKKDILFSIKFIIPGINISDRYQNKDNYSEFILTPELFEVFNELNQFYINMKYLNNKIKIQTIFKKDSIVVELIYGKQQPDFDY